MFERNGEKEFRTEMGVIEGSHHKNLVELYGFYHEDFQRLLVYEYMANGSLDGVLFKGARILIGSCVFRLLGELQENLILT
ncbi:hypothetical protein SUGI_0393130 [Cryptomeria japonica]|nr:hypothetical protein SUGI_0393130 [Cryptomeria japonica]